jgi:hypothetical protein
MRSSLPLFLLLLGSACGSGTAVGTGTADGGGVGSPGVPVTLPDGTTVPTVACGDEAVTSASGTWDVVASGGTSGQGTAVITIDATSFVFTSSGRTLSFAVNGGAMTLQWTETGRTAAPITVTHSGNPVDTGLLPLAVGGQWTFAGETVESCSSSLTANAFNTTCSKVSSPLGRLEGTVIGIRQQQHASVFGELGGRWHLTGNGTGSVDATISGNTFTAVVNGSTGIVGRSGWVTVKVCNGAAAGKTSSGVELAATRH